MVLIDYLENAQTVTGDYYSSLLIELRSEVERKGVENSVIRSSYCITVALRTVTTSSSDTTTVRL